jgi:hypothetical protein
MVCLLPDGDNDCPAGAEDSARLRAKPSATDPMRLGAATRQRVYKRGRSLRNFDQLASIIAVGPFSISKVCRYEVFDLALLDARLGYCP